MSGNQKTKTAFSAVANVVEDILATQAATKQKLNSDASNAALNVLFQRSHGNREIDRSEQLSRAADSAVTLEQFNGRSGLQDSASRQAMTHYGLANSELRRHDETHAKAAMIKEKANRVVAQLKEIKVAGLELTEPQKWQQKTPAANYNHKLPVYAPAPRFGMAA